MVLDVTWNVIVVAVATPVTQMVCVVVPLPEFAFVEDPLLNRVNPVIPAFENADITTEVAAVHVTNHWYFVPIVAVVTLIVLVVAVPVNNPPVRVEELPKGELELHKVREVLYPSANTTSLADGSVGLKNSTTYETQSSPNT